MRKEVERMKKSGLMGIVGLLLLVMAATPAMAAEVTNVTVNASGLYLYDFKYQQTTLDTLKFIGYFNNTNATANLSGTVYLYVNGQQISSVNATVTVQNNTTTYPVELFTYTFSSPGVYNVSVGNDSAWLPNQTVAACVLNKGPIGITGMNINMLKLSDERIKIGGTLTLSAVWGYYNKSEGTRYITIVKWSDYKDLKTGGTINVPGVLDKAVMIKALPEDGGSDSWTYTATEPGYYVVVAFLNSSLFNDSLAFLVESVAIGRPTVSISVDRSVVAQGDFVKVSASMSTDVSVTPVKIFITGAKITTLICNYSASGGVYSVKEACGADEWWVPIGSDRPEGTYVAKIDVGSNETRAEATASFQVVKPQVTSLTVPLQHVIGRDLVIEGVSTLAKSASEADVGSPANISKQNYAQLWIKDLSGNEVFNSSKQKTDANAISLIDDAGKFRFKIDNFGTNKSATGSLDRGFYVVEVKVYSGEVWSEVKTASFELVKATVKLSADKTTVTRGDDITFTITTNLKVNNEVKFTIEDTKFCVDGAPGAPGYDQCTNEKSYYTDAKGQIKIKLKVASEAPLTEYKFKAEETLTGVSDEIKIVVAKQALQLTAEKTTVVGEMSTLSSWLIISTSFEVLAESIS